MSASPVPPGAPLDVDAVERDLRYVLTVVPASPSVVPDALEDALALCAEVRRLRAALAEIANDALISYGEVGIRSGVGDSRLMRLRNAARAALAPTGEPGTSGGDTDA